MEYILWFEEIGKDSGALAGGKGANLGELVNIKMPVPQGFVITTKAFNKFLEINRIAEEIQQLIDKCDVDNTEQLLETSKKIKEMIISKEYPPTIRAELIKAYEELSFTNQVVTPKVIELIASGREYAIVAVRSSATTEDLPSVAENEPVIAKINGKIVYTDMKDLWEKYQRMKTNENKVLIQVPSLDDNKIKWITASEIYKHYVKNTKMAEVITKTGRNITITPDHSLIVLDKKTLEPEVISVYDVNEDTRIPVIKYLPRVKTKTERILDVSKILKSLPLSIEKNRIKLKNTKNWKIANDFPSKININEEFAYFLGIYAAEGSTYENNCVDISCESKIIAKKVKKYLRSLDLRCSKNEKNVRVFNKVLVAILHELVGKPLPIKGKGKLARIKKVPDIIFNQDERIIAMFLKGVFDGDGYVSKESVGLTSVSRNLLGGVAKLLEMLGIRFSFSKKNTIYIFKNDLQRFYDLINFTEKTNRKKIREIIKTYEKSKKHYDFIDNLPPSPKLAEIIRRDLETNLPLQRIKVTFCPYCNGRMKKFGKSESGSQKYFCGSCKKYISDSGKLREKVLSVYVNYDKKGRFKEGSMPWNKGRLASTTYGISHLKKIMEKYGATSLKKILDSDIIWDKIKKIKFRNYSGYVYDFVVPKTQNFAAGLGGIITHNTASFAGQQASFLNVKGTREYLEAVKNCWASLFEPRAIFYRRKQGFKHASIAVVVQRMVNSEKSGVMFTVNPTTGEDVVIIEATWGLGESLVLGEIQPDSYVVSKDGRILEKKIGKKTKMRIRDYATDRTVELEVLKDKVEAQVLTDEEILSLANYGIEIEKHYGKAQDIEFAVERGRIFIVQTRAVTTKAKKEEEKEIVGEPILKGLAVSPGIAKGKVKIVLSMDDIGKVQKGDVLVTRMTSPDMVVVMSRAAGIVTNEGGQTCFSGDTLVLTEKGLQPIKEIYEEIQENKKLKVLSIDCNTLKCKWKKVVNATKRKGNLIRISVSQTGRAKDNTLDLTPDHKIFTLDGFNLVSKSITEILDKNNMVCSIFRIPRFGYTFEDDDLAYLAGAMFSDGYIKLTSRRGDVTFTQKNVPEKLNFISYVRDEFRNAFNIDLKDSGTDLTFGNIRGRNIVSEVNRFKSSRKFPAYRLLNFKNKLSRWCLSTDEENLAMFLAGLIDGDGSVSLDRDRFHIYSGKKFLFEPIILSSLRLGILPQVCRNRESCLNFQIVGNNAININRHLKRVKGITKRKRFDYRFFAAKQLLEKIVDKVNYKSRIKPYVQKNLLIGSNILENFVLALCDNASKQSLERILKSDLTMVRVKKIAHVGNSDVYNLTVDAKREDDHNYVVFTKRFTPIVVKNCHAAIVSREMGIPCVVGTGNATEVLKDDQLVTVDAYKGLIYPGEIKIEKPEEKEEAGEVETPKEFEKIITTAIKVNLAFPERVEAIAKRVDGVGLLRIEHMITKAGVHPAKLVKEGRAEEYIQILLEGIRPIAKAFYPKPVWVRTLDARSDEFRNLEGGAEEPKEDNPMLGWHGIRRSLDEPELLKAEFEAIKRLHKEGLKNVHVMLPFVITVEEFRKARKIAKEIDLPKTVNMGIMVETPAAALTIKDFCKAGIDFVSFGTNDLSQLTLGVDRNNAKIAGIFTETHSAVKKMINYVIKVCRSYKVETSVCGEAPSNIPQFVEFLVKAGIDSISVNIDAIDKVRATVIRTEKKLLLEALRKKLNHSEPT